MPIHDWTRVPSGLFHHFHQDWSIEIARALNRGPLPKGFAALVEQRYGVWEADVLTVESRPRRERQRMESGGLLTMPPPSARIVRRSNKEIFAARANRIAVRHHLGRIVAVIEIVSPGNKDSRAALTAFVEKDVDFLQQGIHLLVVDLFPPTPRDPFGLHKAIWDYIDVEPFTFPDGKDRILASYESGDERAAYVEPVAIGDVLAEMPLFLAPGMHIRVPLESTYRATWDATPEDLRIAVETGVLPDPDADEG
jgi:Protein of unknown function (DUF4058)